MARQSIILHGSSLILLVSACGANQGTEVGGSGGTTPMSSGGINSASGGASSGGAFASGGLLSSGGQSVAGQSFGGQLAAGGLASSGGQFTSGGQTGGRSATGGSAAGGQANGGRAAGGRSSGGQGGTTTGGRSATGGGAAGGASGGESVGGTSSGCGRTGAATGVQSQPITVGSQARTYVLSVPSAYAGDTPLPLVFAWHGLGGTGTMARQYFRIEQSSAGNALFAYPDGLPIANQDNQSGWDLATSGIDVALFDAILKEVSAAYCVDMNRVFSTGHSFGALMTNALGCYRGDVLRAIAPVAGAPPNAYSRPGSSVSCAGEVAAWIAHGENDTTVDYTKSGIASRDFWLTRNGCSTTSEPTAPSPCVAYQGCRDGLPVNWCVHQDAHNWPSFAGSGIWSFFASFN